MVAVLGFFAIGCTPMEWRRGEEVATLETEDFMRCRNYASREATRHLPVTGLYPVPYVGRDARGNPVAQLLVTGKAGIAGHTLI